MDTIKNEYKITLLKSRYQAKLNCSLDTLAIIAYCSISKKLRILNTVITPFNRYQTLMI